MSRSKDKGPTPKKGRPLDEITAELHQHRVAKLEAERERAALSLKRPALLADTSPAGDAELDALELEQARCARRIERAEIAIADLAAEQVASQKAAEQARRLALYEAGQRASGEYRRLAETEYAEAARKIADVMKRMTDLSAQCDAANADRPEGAHAIDCDAFTRSKNDPRHLPPLPHLVYLPSVRTVERDFWSQGAPE